MGAITARMLDELGYDPDASPAESLWADRSRRPLLADVTLVPTGTIVAARDGARDVALARLASGRLVVLDDACPHDGGTISDGFVDGEHLVCVRHGWELAVVGALTDANVLMGRACRQACKPRE